MKIESVLDESIELDEFINLGLTKKQRMMKQANKAAKGSINSEIDQMEVELMTYMRNSGEKYATPSIVKNYLQKKGLGKVGGQIVDQVASQAANKGSLGANLAGLGKKAATAAAGAASGIAAAARSGDAPPNPRPTGPKSAPASSAPADNPQASPAQAQAPAPEAKPLPKGTVAKLGNGEEFEWLGAQWRSKKTGKMANKDQKAELVKNATAQTSSINESEEAILSKRQIKNILTQVIQKAYGQSAGFKRSSFATDNDGPDIQGMIDTLQSMGYKVTK